MTKEEALKLALEALKMCRGLIRNNIENLVPIESPNPWFSQDVDHAIAAIREALEQPEQEPTVPNNSQEWAGMDGTTAYWLIQRHADGWADVGKMMSEWLNANKAQPEHEPVAIKWTLDGDKTCGYNNWLGKTPFGRILITWKGWKKYHDACVDEFPGDFHAYGLPDEVKELCEAEFAKRIGYTTSPQRKPLTDEEITEAIRTSSLYMKPSPHTPQSIWLALLVGYARAIEAAHGIKE